MVVSPKYEYPEDGQRNDVKSSACSLGSSAPAENWATSSALALNWANNEPERHSGGLISGRGGRDSRLGDPVITPTIPSPLDAAIPNFLNPGRTDLKSAVTYKTAILCLSMRRADRYEFSQSFA